MTRATVVLLWTLLVAITGCTATQGSAATPNRRLARPKGSPDNPASVPYLAAVQVDGDGSEWAAVSAMPAPFQRKEASSLKLCWNEKGVYGLATVKTAKIPPSSETPWSGDCVELWIEKDCARAESTSDTDKATQYAFAPNPDSDKGEATCVIASGRDSPAALKGAWKKSEGGFTIEFFIPAASLAPAQMKAGTKVGLNFSIDVAGRAVEQFYHDKDIDSGYSYLTPGA